MSCFGVGMVVDDAKHSGTGGCTVRRAMDAAWYTVFKHLHFEPLFKLEGRLE